MSKCKVPTRECFWTPINFISIFSIGVVILLAFFGYSVYNIRQIERLATQMKAVQEDVKDMRKDYKSLNRYLTARSTQDKKVEEQVALIDWSTSERIN